MLLFTIFFFYSLDFLIIIYYYYLFIYLFIYLFFWGGGGLFICIQPCRDAGDIGWYSQKVTKLDTANFSHPFLWNTTC